MTHRERVLAAISHRAPDMVPLDLGGTRNSSIVVEGYERLKTRFGVRDDSLLFDRMQRCVEVDEHILRALDIDTRAVPGGLPSQLPPQPADHNRYGDSWGVERVQPSGSYYYDQERFPLTGEITVSDIAGYPWPDPEDAGLTRGVKERLRWIRQNTDCAAVLTIPAPFVHTSQYLRGFEDWFIDFATGRTRLAALFDAVLEINLRVAERLLREAGDDADVVVCGDDLGGQNGLLVSDEDYRKLIKPRHAAYFRQVHELSGAKLLFHCCGSVISILDDLVEIGVDVLNPVQVTARGMAPGELKRKYRGSLAFWGAMDTQHVLPAGTVEDVRRMVEQRIEELGEGGGYVLAACHNLQPDVPLENILAMFEHAREYRPSFGKA